jgi:glucose/mannose-6-phosphate isomerase
LKGPKKFDAIIFCGMGGSGTPGSILQNIADCAIVNIPVLTWRDAGLPAHPFRTPLYIFVSFSGNTRETLSGLTQAIKKKAQVAVVAGGGKLLATAQKNGLPYATFKAPASLQPRQGYGFTLYGALALLNIVFPRLGTPDLRAQIDPKRFAVSAKKTAARIRGKTTLVYSTHAHQHLGQIFKISISETGKSLAFANTIPEVNHNELNLIETKPKHLYALFVTTTQELKKRKHEFHLTKEVLLRYGIASELIALPSGTPLATTAHAITWAQWLGYHAATLIGRDPMGLEVVNAIKERARKKGLG